MVKSVKSRAEEQFAATQKRDKQALREKEEARQVNSDQVSRLRALRLAKEVSDKKAADQEAAKKAATKKKKTPR